MRGAKMLNQKIRDLLYELTGTSCGLDDPLDILDTILDAALVSAKIMKLRSELYEHTED